MRMKLTITLIILTALSGILASPNWVLMTEEWLKKNPESLPIWLTPDELSRLDDIGTRLDPTDPPPVPVRHVAEFEPMEGVLIRYPLGIPTSLVAAMSEHVTVVTIVSSNWQQNQAINTYTSNGVNLANCEFIIAPTDSYWTRDYGPFFVFDGNEELGVVNFSYNRPRPADDNIPVVFATHNNLPLYGMDIIHTGGNYMSDGHGTAASTHIVYTENSSLTNDQVDQFVDDFLGISEHIVVQDPTGAYIDHIDTWAKFLAPDKILIRSVPTTHSQYQDIEDTVDFFAGLTSAYGTPYRIYRVYTPNDQPYTNSLIMNDRVYVPQVNSTWDSDAITIYEEAMPGYEIVGIYSSSWQSTDALHCRTKEIADRGMLYIRHLPLLNEQPYDSEYEINAYIYPYSNEPLYTDSLKVYYRLNSQDYQSVNLDNLGGNYFSATLTAFSPGDTLSYYIYAADQSGRTANHPFIGAPDPHVFIINDEGLPPAIEHIPYTEVYIDDLPLLLEAVVLDPHGIASVVLEYRINSDDPQFEEFDYVGDDTYICVIGDGLEAEDFVEYRIIAVDMENPPNTAFSPIEGWHSFTIDYRKVSTPYFTPESGTYQEEIYVTIETDTDSALIYYTLDESPPDTDDNIYTGSLLITETTTIKAIAYLDGFQPSEIAVAEYIIDISSADDVSLPSAAKLHPAYPNPFNPAVNISFTIAENSQVTVDIYNIQGKLVETLVDGYYPAGEHRFVWNGRDLDNNEASAGIYLYRLRVTNPSRELYEKTRKMLLLK